MCVNPMKNPETETNGCSGWINSVCACVCVCVCVCVQVHDGIGTPPAGYFVFVCVTVCEGVKTN